MKVKINLLDDALSNNEKVDLSLSYSRVSDFDRNGPRALLEKSGVDSQALKIGSLVDDLLFNTETFNKKYHISDFNEPTASLGTLCKIILTNFTELPKSDVILNIVRINDLWSATKDVDKLIAKFNTNEFWGYLNDKFKSLDKIVVTSDEFIKAEGVVNDLKEHPFSKAIFDPTLEHIYQHSFRIKINQFYFRGILDIITIDHENKIVYFKDLKTGGGSSDEFNSSFIKWRYYLQEAVYTLAFEEICKGLNLVDYKLAPFEFIYIGLKERIPISYIVTPDWHYGALNGFKTVSGYRYKGLYELIDEIYFHWKNQIYDLSMNVYKNNGRINLEDNFIKISRDEV